jgi:hypothetical protein
MIVVCNTTSSHEEYNGDCDYAVIEMNDAIKERILAFHKLFLEARAKCDSLYEMYFWDYTPDFYNCTLVDGGNTPWMDRVQTDEFAVERSIDLSHAKDARQSVECEQLIIREDDFCWTAIPKHSSIYVTTKSFKYEQLKDM